MSGSSKYIDYQVENGRARITLNRPEKRNALSIELVEELRDGSYTCPWDCSPVTVESTPFAIDVESMFPNIP